MKRAARVLAATTLLTVLAAPAQAEKRTAIFAGGAFWSVEADFDKLPGVLATTPGYIGGSTANPTYFDHAATGHREAVAVLFDDARLPYDELVSDFFHSIDPADADGQFCDRGHSYTTAIYTVGEDEMAAAQKGKAAAEKELKQAIVTGIVAAPQFWPAEEYHQDYYKKNPARYQRSREACGRDRRVQEIWGEKAYKPTTRGR